jgi:hypothetical protein
MDQDRADISMSDDHESGVDAVSDVVFFYSAPHINFNNDNHHDLDDDEDGDDYDQDESMGNDNDFELNLIALHSAAAHNFAIKTNRIHNDIIFLPSLQSIYFDPNNALVPNAPPDLQLGVYFAMYNDIAKAKFRANKSLPMEINRAIWYYGLDNGHSFSSFFDQIRYNIILMAFVLASRFDTRYCKEGCEKFVKGFLHVSVTPDSTACASSVSLEPPKSKLKVC